MREPRELPRLPACNERRRGYEHALSCLPLVIATILVVPATAHVLGR